MKDVDDWLQEEEERMQEDNHTFKSNMNPSHGWIHKKSQSLIDELMLSCSVSTLRRHIKVLTDKQFIEERTNPTNKRDQTLQYRVDLARINHSLMLKGYSIQDYKLSYILRKDKNSKISYKEFMQW